MKNKMELIDKAAVVAEIKMIISKLRKSCNPNPFGTLQECLTDAEIEALHLILDYINTLEVKCDIQDVKKVSENSDTLEEKTWKPDEEQMRAFSAMIRFVEIATSFDAHKQRLVESLYQELSKLVLK